MLQESLSLKDLVNLEDWQRIQDLFADVLEVTLQTISLYGAQLSKKSRPNRLCDELLPKLSCHSGFCADYLLGAEVKDPINIKEKTSFKCPLGLDIYVVPIKAAGDMVVAYMVVGPIILKSRKAISEYTEDAKRLGIRLEDLADATIDINVFTYNKAYSLTRLVESVFSHRARAGYHKKRLGEVAPELLKMDPMSSRYYEEKILSSLLRSCTLALGTDSGSVMTFDKKTDTLHIKVSQKLNKGAENDTDIKMGEGIAGLAASTAQAIILPKDEDNINLSGKLKRKDIKSSMIMPFNKGSGHDLAGVINLNMIRKGKDFSEKDIALVKELTNLASLALAPLQEKDQPSS